MKKFVTTLAAMAFVGFMGSVAFAGGEGCCGAAAGKAMACSEKGSEAEQVDMTKGGGAVDKTAEGYALGQRVPDFKLNDATGTAFDLAKDKGTAATVLVFYNQGCPFVVEAKDRINEFTKEYAAKGVKLVAVDAGVNNDAAAVKGEAQKVSFPILVNRESDLAVKFKATRTPEVFVLDKNGVVQYTGAFDNGEAGAEPGARKAYTKDAVEAVIAGKTPDVRQTKANGCSIKLNPASKKTAAADHKGHDHKEQSS